MKLSPIIPWVLLAIAGTYLVVTLFSRSKPPVDHSELIKEIQQQRDYFRKGYDSVISLSRERDTVLVEKFIQLNDKAKTIRPVVTNLSNDQLRAEIIRYAVPADNNR